MNHTETEKLLTTIEISYPRPSSKEFNAEDFEKKTILWQRSLADFSYRDVFHAFEYWINTEKFPPSLAEFKPICVKIKNPNSSALISPERAWETVDYAVRKFGSYNQDKAFATFSDATVRAVRNIGGWQKICATELGQSWEFLRKNFISAYTEFNSENRERIMLPESVLKRLQEVSEKKQLEAK